MFLNQLKFHFHLLKVLKVTLFFIIDEIKLDESDIEAEYGELFMNAFTGLCIVALLSNVLYHHQ